MQSKFFRWFAGMSCISLSMLAAQSAHAQIKVGVTISTTGPAAAIGAPTRNAMLLWPKEVAGHKVEYIILDDASDTTNAVRNLRKLTTEEKVDIVVGPNTTPNALAMLDALAESQTPMVALAASASIVEPQDGPRR